MPDDKYWVEIIRDSLADYSGRVVGEEAGGAEFIDNIVTVVETRLVNLAKFKTSGLGEVLDTETVFVPLGAIPSGHTSAWQGPILIDGISVATDMFRRAIP